MNASGGVITSVISFSIPVGKLSTPVDLWRFSFLSSFLTATAGIYVNVKIESVLERKSADSLFQTNCRSGKVFSFKLFTMEVKNSQKEFALATPPSTNMVSLDLLPGKVDLMFC